MYIWTYDLTELENRQFPKLFNDESEVCVCVYKVASEKRCLRGLAASLGMNLGDGLLFELENGKPKLIVLRRGAEKDPSKASSQQLLSKSRAANILTPRQPSRLDDVPVERPARQQASKHQDARDKARAGAAPFPSRTSVDAGRGSTTMASKTQEHHIAVKPDRLKHTTRAKGKIGQNPNGGKKGGAKVALKDTLVSGDEGLKDGMVCLTSEQLQQIISSLQSSRNDQRASEDRTIQSSERKESESGYSETEGGIGEMKEDGGGREDILNGHVTDMTGRDKNNRLPGLFSWLEERQSDSRAAVDAKKAQWRRELNEQVALKQQQRLEPGRLQGEEDTGSVLSVHSSLNHRDQPSAIRSSLKLGEFTPMEEVLGVEKREEEKRRWLEELDQQREEAAERRKREKLLRNQAEDHELWAMHFDSLQRRPPTRNAAPSAPPPGPLCGSERREWEPSSSLSMAWDTSSSCEAESVGGASVDTTSRPPPRNGYLRTMTALLDPVQLEEREKRRLKHLEHQKALQAQIEERRLQKAQEEEKMRLQQEEEERRVELEREKILRQEKMDADRERRKDEQEKKAPAKPPEPPEPSVASRQTGCSTEEINNTDISHKHIAVQTEAAPPVQLGAKDLQTPEFSADHQPAPLPPPPPAPTNRGARAGRTGKENICHTGGGVEAGGGGGGGVEGDPYEVFARTNRNRKEKKKPEWNTQRPTRQFVPASERYPAPLQKNRKESRLKRQAELLALQERSRLLRSDPPPPPHPPQTKTTARKVGTVSQHQTNSATVNPESSSVRHPVPSQQDSSASPPPPTPPLLELVPFIRTEDEVLNLDPLECADVPPPPTAAPPQSSASSPANSHRDVLLHPELLQDTRTPRQQEILRGLAQLRQGLLQRQKELEMELYPE